MCGGGGGGGGGRWSAVPRSGTPGITPLHPVCLTGQRDGLRATIGALSSNEDSFRDMKDSIFRQETTETIHMLVFPQVRFELCETI